MRSIMSTNIILLFNYIFDSEVGIQFFFSISMLHKFFSCQRIKVFLFMFSVVIPIMLTVYGIGCIPQAYLFSLGPRTALNTMTFVILNVVFGKNLKIFIIISI